MHDAQYIFFSTPAMLEKSMEEAKRGGYALGVKLVRGAYHSFETSHFNTLPESERRDTSAPVWGTKEQTDLCYNLVRGILRIRLQVQGLKLLAWLY